MSGGLPRVTFYDCAPEARGPIIAGLAEAAWRKGRKLLVFTSDAQAARALDEVLWTWRDDAFLPHEVVAPGAEPADEQARVVIVYDEADPIGADVLVQLAPASMAFARGYRSVIDLVDHTTPERLAASRARFKAWRDAGADPAFVRR